MTELTGFWLALLASIVSGLAYYRFAIQPSHSRARLDGAVRAFGRVIELRFPNHAGLTEVVVRLGRKVGTRRGLNPGRLRDLETSIRLRDIGLCAIPYRLVNRKPWDEWTLSESATYDCHAEVGGAILEAIPALSMHSETVRMHHAPFTPPVGVADFRVPPTNARIIKGCAEFVWHLRYRGLDAAVRHISQGAGTLYDPGVAGDILALAGEGAAVMQEAPVSL